MSKIIEAIMALNERTCMMYPDYNFIKAAEAIPSHDTDNDLLPDLLIGLTIEITRDGEVIYSFFIAESSISTELTRGMMLKTEEVDIIMNVLKTKEKPEDLTFISPVIYEDAEPGKITLKSFSLSEDSDILPETDGVYKYTVTDKDDALAISITGDSGVYNTDFKKAFVHTTEQIEGKSIAVLYPIPPLFDGIIYNGNEYKRLNDAFNEKAEGKPYSGIGLRCVFDLDSEYYSSKYVNEGIIDITNWPILDDKYFIDHYFVRAHEDIISEVRHSSGWLENLQNKHGYDLLERTVYTVRVIIPGVDGDDGIITIAETIELETEYGFNSGDILSESNMEKIQEAAKNVDSKYDILVGNIVQDYYNNTLILVAAIRGAVRSRATDDKSSEITFMDTRINNKGTLYTYTLNDLRTITVKRNEKGIITDYVSDGIPKDTIQLISPITNAIMIKGVDVDIIGSFILDELFSGIPFDGIWFDGSTKTVDISHWSLCHVKSLNGIFSDFVMRSLKCNYKDAPLDNICIMDELCRCCTSLKNVELTSLPFNIKSIDNAFAGCKSLSEMIISDVILDVNSLNGLFNGCSSPGGVEAQIYINNNGTDSPNIESFTDTFTNVLSMQITTNNDTLFSVACNSYLRWYCDDGNEHGYTTCEYGSVSNTFEIQPRRTTSRLESIVPLICSGVGGSSFTIASSAIGPNVDYPGENITIRSINFVDVTNNTTFSYQSSEELSYITDILPDINTDDDINAFKSALVDAFSNKDLENGIIVETLPDHYQTVLNKSETITLRCCPVGSTNNPYEFDEVLHKFVFDYSSVSDAFEPPFRRPMLITKDSEEVTLGMLDLDLNSMVNDAIRSAQPISGEIADYTHWDTITYLTTTVIEQTLGSDQNGNEVNTIIAPHVNDSILDAMVEKIDGIDNGSLKLYTYTNINGDVQGNQPTYQPITDCPSKINGMQGYVIECKKAVT